MRHICLLLAILFSFASCGGNATKKGQTTTETSLTDGVEVLYFHGKQRCVTCNAIEKLTKEVVDSLNNDKIVMKIIDISQKENQPTADKYEVTWSSLILDRNGKVENLTDMGFSYAKNQPEEFKKKLTESLKSILR